jgi:nucleotide-binding universal stress UspA family protein
MAYRDVLAILTSGEEKQALRAAKLVAAKSAGRVSALHVFEMPEVVASAGPEMLALWPQLLEQTRTRAAGEKKEIEQQLKAAGIGEGVLSLESPRGLAGQLAARHAMRADITIMQTPNSDLGRAVFEGALFRSGRPVVLIPREWKRDTLGDTVLVAWKPTREATRAIADAAPFISGAKTVTIATVDGELDDDRQEPGYDVSRRLASAGANVAVRNIASQGRATEIAIAEEARTLGADLIVMGGYGHARIAEFVFGGVTRSLSRDCPVPILMSH